MLEHLTNSMNGNVFIIFYFIPGVKHGMEVWILGLVERDSNTHVLYALNDRSADTLFCKKAITLNLHVIPPFLKDFSDSLRLPEAYVHQ